MQHAQRISVLDWLDLQSACPLQDSFLALLQEVSANAALALKENCWPAREVVAECRLARFDLKAAKADYTLLCKAGLTTAQVSHLMIVIEFLEPALGQTGDSMPLLAAPCRQAVDGTQRSTSSQQSVMWSTCCWLASANKHLVLCSYCSSLCFGSDPTAADSMTS